MQFSAMQASFASLHKDDRTEWILNGTSNKAALNEGLDEVFRKLVNTAVGKKLLTKYKAPVTVSSFEGTLPADFYEICEAFVGNGTFFTPIDTIPYTVRFDAATSTQKFRIESDTVSQVYVDYVPNIGKTTLSGDTDVPKIPESLHKSVIDYALVEYFRQNLDWASVSNALQYAEGKFNERVAQIWTD